MHQLCGGGGESSSPAPSIASIARTPIQSVTAREQLRRAEAFLSGPPSSIRASSSAKRPYSSADSWVTLTKGPLGHGLWDAAAVMTGCGWCGKYPGCEATNTTQSLVNSFYSQVIMDFRYSRCTMVPVPGTGRLFLYTGENQSHKILGPNSGLIAPLAGALDLATSTCLCHCTARACRARLTACSST